MANQEKRSTPREGEITDDQVRGAAMRVIRENLNLNEAKFTEGEEMRDRVREFFAETAGLSTSEVQPIENTEEPAVAESSETTETRELSPEEQEELLSTFEERFNTKPKGYKRSKGIKFPVVKAALEASPQLMWSLAQLENSGSLMDIRAIEGNEFVFCDHSIETPESRRDMTYYQIQEAAEAMGVDIQSEEGWRALQKAGKFDLNSWIWVKSEDIIDTGLARGAHRFGGDLVVNRVLADYHNPDWGWRAELRVPKA